MRPGGDSSVVCWVRENCILSFLLLAESSGARCGLCCYSQSALRCDVLCVFRCSSAYLGFHWSVFDSLLLLINSKQPDLSLLSSGINKAFAPKGTAAHRIFSVLNLRDGYEGKVISFWNTQTNLSDTNNNVQSFKSPFFNILMLSLNFSRLSWLRLNSSSRCDWLFEQVKACS